MADTQKKGPSWFKIASYSFVTGFITCGSLGYTYHEDLVKDINAKNRVFQDVIAKGNCAKYDVLHQIYVEPCLDDAYRRIIEAQAGIEPYDEDTNIIRAEMRKTQPKLKK